MGVAGSLTGTRSVALPKAAGVVGFALLTALAAQVTIPLPGTPVPITLQTLAVTLAPLALGAWGGAASMALYVALGLFGLPVYADASGGWHVVYGATFGYLLGFIACQPVMAWVVGKRENRSAALGRVLGAMAAGHAVIFGLGLAWLWVVLERANPGVGLAKTLEMGLWPFLAGSVFKTALALLVAGDLMLWSRRRGWSSGS